MRRVLHEVPWDHAVEEDEHGELWLVVLRGTVGVYEVALPLDRDQTLAFRARGPSALAAWVKRVRTTGR